MTEHERHEQHGLDVLDFPGADRLRAAGDVAPPNPAVVSAALTAVRAAAADSATVVPFGSRGGPPRGPEPWYAAGGGRRAAGAARGP
ncbi:hypothetical protein ABT189_43940, partial [Streptomyces sp900105755]